MAEALDAREHAAAPANDDDDGATFPLDDLPNDLLVSVFEAVGDLRWARLTVPLVCKAWAELYRSKGASPLHETLEVDSDKEWEAAREMLARRALGPAAGTAAQERPLDRLFVHGSRVVSWVERRAGSVRKLHLKGVEYYGSTKNFSPEDSRRLVAVVGSSLTELSVDFGLHEQNRSPFWEALRASVVPHGRLRSLVVKGHFSDVSVSDIEPLGQLAGSLEELELHSSYDGSRLTRLPESLCALTELRRLVLACHEGITTIPAQISSLKKLKELTLSWCRLSSLPKELGELSGLTKLNLSHNLNLGYAPQGEAFPAELGNMKSLRVLNLSWCALRAVPAFVGEMESLKSLDLSDNSFGIISTSFVGELKSLRHLNLSIGNLRAVPAFVGELESLESLDLSRNTNLEHNPRGEAFPAELGNMKSLRRLNLPYCDLRAVPAFVGELESLEILDLCHNKDEIPATLNFLIEGCPRLREVRLSTWGGAFWTPETLAHLEIFKAKLLAKNPNAKVTWSR